MKKRIFTKFLSLLLVCVVCFSGSLFIAACDNGDLPDNPPGTNEPEPNEPEPNEPEPNEPEPNEPEPNEPEPNEPEPNPYATTVGASRGQIVYEDINGKDVTVNFFSRRTGYKYYNPTFAGAEMINGAIKYKKANPEEDVEVIISAFHYHIQTAACIDKDSKYYGLMRRLNDKEFDDDGFIRVSYLSVLAAKAGIRVRVLGQIEQFMWYYEQYVDSKCDNGVSGIVGDYLTAIRSPWTSYGDRSAADMMHYKLYAASHIIDTEGDMQENVFWLSSQNLDQIRPDGENDHDTLQTAIMVYNHDYLYRCAVNYFDVLFANQTQEGVYNFRDIIISRNVEQYSLYQQGKADEIPADEHILYLGTASDSIFELYFTPLGSAMGAFDTELNPYAKYTAKMLDSEDYVLFSFLGTKYNDSSFTRTWTEVINTAFVNVNNPNSKFFFSLSGMRSQFEPIVVGENASFKVIGGVGTGFHSKDIFVSWAKGGERYYSVVMSSTNIHEGALSYQANSMLVINENDTIGNPFFDLYSRINGFGMFD